MKTKEEILEGLEYKTLKTEFPVYGKENVLHAMEIFAMQFEDDNGRAKYYEDKIDMLNRIISKNKNLYTVEDLRDVIAEAWNSCEDNEGEEPFTEVMQRILQSKNN